MVVVLMGPAGAGKTTVGRALSDATGWRFVDADEYHSAANIEKMRRGEPLDDDDRDEWLRTLHGVIVAAADRDADLIVACSALKRRYRDRLAADVRDVRFVYLRVPARVLERRVTLRPDHFASAALIPSQLAALEQPSEAFEIDGTLPPGDIVAAIRRRLAI